MAYEQRSYSGNAPPTTLSTGVTASALTLSVVDGTGYPNGDDGPFFIVVDPETALEEKVLVASRSGNTFTVATVLERGADSTTQQAHGAGAIVQHVHTATDAMEANQSVVQGIAKVTSKGDLIVGTGVRVTGRLAVGANNDDALIVDSGQTTGLKFGKAAPSEHTHAPGQGGNIPSSSVAGLDAHFVDTSSHGVGEVVGTDETQTLTNKTITGATITGSTLTGASLTSPTLLTPTLTDPTITYATRREARGLTGTNAERLSYSPAYDGDTWYETDTQREYVRRGSAWHLVGPKPTMRHSRSTNGSITGGVWTGMDWDYKITDSWNTFNETNNSWVLPVSGWYQCTFTWHCFPFTTAYILGAALYWINPSGGDQGVWAYNNTHPTSSPAGYSATVTGSAYFFANSAIYCMLYSDVFTQVYGNIVASYFMGHLVDAY